MSRPQLERKLTSCAIGAILARPDLYVQAVGSSADQFWLRDDRLNRTAQIVGLNASLASVERTVLPWLGRAFLLATAEAVLALLLMRSAAAQRAGAPRARPDMLAAIAVLVFATAWYGFAVASLTEWGSNARYRSAVQPAIVAAVVLGNACFFRSLWRVIRAKRVGAR
jgi:hypothetical protein